MSEMNPCFTVQDQPWSTSYHTFIGGPAIIKIKITGAPSMHFSSKMDASPLVSGTPATFILIIAGPPMKI